MHIDEVDEETRVISMDLDKDEKRLAVGLGHVVHGADESITLIVVFEVQTKKDRKGMKYIAIKEITRTVTAFDAGVSIEFEFSDNDIEKLIMFSKKEILIFDYMRDGVQVGEDGRKRSKITHLYPIEGLRSQPDFVSFNKD